MNPPTRLEVPNEMRGTSIDGGETRHLSKGDVPIVPTNSEFP
jgi:hypothetical protein